MNEIELVVSVPEVPLWALIVAGSLPYLLIGMLWGRSVCRWVIATEPENNTVWGNGVFAGFVILFFWPLYLAIRVLALPVILLYKMLTYGVPTPEKSK